MGSANSNEVTTCFSVYAGFAASFRIWLTPTSRLHRRKEHLVDKYLRFMITLCIGLLSIAGSLLMGASTMYAAGTSTDPLVAIATVHIIPASACTITKVILKGTSEFLTGGRRACDLDKAALQITSDQVRRSEALAHREAYVVLPRATVTKAIRERANHQIVDMMYAKRNAFRQDERRQHTVPNETCATDPGVGSYWYSSWGWTVYGDNIYQGVTWEEAYGCQYLNIQSAKTGYNGGPVINPDYWERIRYASIDVGTGCRFIGTNSSLSQSIGRTDGADYTFEFWYDEQSGCSGSYVYDDLPLS